MPRRRSRSRKRSLAHTLEFPRWVVAVGVFAIGAMAFISGHRDADGARLPIGAGGRLYFAVLAAAALAVVLIGRRRRRRSEL